eukprot:Gb_04188 [translate_table: standard]
MGKRKQSDEVAGLVTIKFREHDDVKLQEELKEMSNDDLIYKVLENIGLCKFLTLPQLFYEELLLFKAIVAVARHPKNLYLSNVVIHAVTTLPGNVPDIAKGAKLNREQATQEYCETLEDYSTSGIRIDGLMRQQRCRIAEMMALKLFGLQCPTYVPTHLLEAITGAATGKKYNWCGHIKLRIQKMLIMVSKATKQASFFMPSIFFVILLHAV